MMWSTLIISILLASEVKLVLRLTWLANRSLSLLSNISVASLPLLRHDAYSYGKGL